MKTQRYTVILRRAAIGAGVTLLAGWPFAGALAAAPPLVPVSQVPMTVQIPAHPQILLAVGNSQSMDGDLSGAIWTGSGGLGHDPAADFRGRFLDHLLDGEPVFLTLPAHEAGAVIFNFQGPAGQRRRFGH